MVPYPTFRYERHLIASGSLLIAGVDEAGCGAWAGPVYAAAVILPLNSRLRLVRDSKTLSPRQRECLTSQIKERATAWAVGMVSHEEVDALNIRRASALAMRRSIEALHLIPEHILSDAFPIPGLSIPCTPIIRGDRHVKSIAAASIIAKTARDAWMKKLEAEYPGYGFAQHKGYGTKQHQEALKRLGPCEIHRMSYRPIKNLLSSRVEKKNPSTRYLGEGQATTSSVSPSSA